MKADAMEISCVGPMIRQHMPRSDLAFIFRATVLNGQQARTGPFWDKSYLFAASDGKVGFSCSASDFTDEGITEFAQRLQVPIRGEFSAKIGQFKDRVDPTSD